jgi:hypothetical protein
MAAHHKVCIFDAGNLVCLMKNSLVLLTVRIHDGEDRRNGRHYSFHAGVRESATVKATVAPHARVVTNDPTNKVG